MYCNIIAAIIVHLPTTYAVPASVSYKLTSNSWFWCKTHSSSESKSEWGSNITLWLDVSRSLKRLDAPCSFAIQPSAGRLNTSFRSTICQWGRKPIFRILFSYFVWKSLVIAEYFWNIAGTLIFRAHPTVWFTELCLFLSTILTLPIILSAKRHVFIFVAHTSVVSLLSFFFSSFFVPSRPFRAHDLIVAASPLASLPGVRNLAVSAHCLVTGCQNNWLPG